MNDAPRDSVLSSGLVELTPENLDHLPTEPGWFRLRSPGQRVMLIGHAGAEGLGAAVRASIAGQPIAGFATVEYETRADADDARVAAAADIAIHKPLYNDGFGRYRNSEIHLPKKGHRVRAAMNNP